MKIGYTRRWFENHNHEFDKWWDADKFDISESYYLLEYCSEHFDKWWDSDKFELDDSYLLAYHCSEHFDKWWDSDKFDWSIASGELVMNCSDH